MSPLPADDLPPEDIKLPKRTVAAVKPTNGVAEVSLPEETLRAGMPIIRARVVYLGPGESYSMSIPGQVHETYVEDAHGTMTRTDRDGRERTYTVLKVATTTGITQYDFSIRDSKGHFIHERMMPEGTKYAGRPFSWCEHVSHLRKFFLERDKRGERLYHVMTRPENVGLLQDHIRQTERSRKAQEQLYSEITTR